MIDKALKTAERCHKGQTRVGKNGTGTYFKEHVLKVYELILNEEKIDDENILVVSLLHDVIEDTDYTCRDIEYNFGVNISECVDNLTKREGEKFSDYADRLFENGGYTEYIVKFADRLQNLRCMKYKNDKKWMEKKLIETERYILPYKERGIKKIKNTENISDILRDKLIKSMNSMNKKIKYETEKNWSYIREEQIHE